MENERKIVCFSAMKLARFSAMKNRWDYLNPSVFTPTERMIKGNAHQDRIALKYPTAVQEVGGYLPLFLNVNGKDTEVRIYFSLDLYCPGKFFGEVKTFTPTNDLQKDQLFMHQSIVQCLFYMGLLEFCDSLQTAEFQMKKMGLTEPEVYQLDKQQKTPFYLFFGNAKVKIKAKNPVAALNFYVKKLNAILKDWDEAKKWDIEFGFAEPLRVEGLVGFNSRKVELSRR